MIRVHAKDKLNQGPITVREKAIVGLDGLGGSYGYVPHDSIRPQRVPSETCRGFAFLVAFVAQ